MLSASEVYRGSIALRFLFKSFEYFYGIPWRNVWLVTYFHFLDCLKHWNYQYFFIYFIFFRLHTLAMVFTLRKHAFSVRSLQESHVVDFFNLWVGGVVWKLEKLCLRIEGGWGLTLLVVNVSLVGFVSTSILYMLWFEGNEPLNCYCWHLKSKWTKLDSSVGIK